MYIKIKKIAHWADEFSTDDFGEMLALICKCRSSKENKSNFELKIHFEELCLLFLIN